MYWMLKYSRFFVRGVVVIIIVIVLAARRDKSLLYLDLSTDNRLNCPAVFCPYCYVIILPGKILISTE
jgi:hypothetical protein